MDATGIGPMLQEGVLAAVRRSEAQGAGQDEAREDLVQAPPAAHHEGSLPDQPEPGQPRAEDVVTKNRTGQESFAGKEIFSQSLNTLAYQTNVYFEVIFFQPQPRLVRYRDRVLGCQARTLGPR